MILKIGKHKIEYVSSEIKHEKIEKVVIARRVEKEIASPINWQNNL